MIHLITITGKDSKAFYLNQKYIPDFKSIVRTLISGRVMIISTTFRSDLFYAAEKPASDAILKLWAFYTGAEPSVNNPNIMMRSGDEEALSSYFEDLDKLSTNWYQYRTYKRAFGLRYTNDHQNPVTKKIVQCDQYLIDYTGIERLPLVSPSEKIEKHQIFNSTMPIALRTLHDRNLSN